MGKPYKVCPLCGAHLDACETCEDCKEREAKRLADLRKPKSPEQAAEPRRFEGQKAG